MEFRILLSGVFLFVGCFFIVVASVGIIRFPDFFSRIHPAGKSDTMGQAFILFGLFIYEGLSFDALKLWMIILFVIIANPTATHAVTKAAFLAGLKPWLVSSEKPEAEGVSSKKEDPEPSNKRGKNAS